MTISKREIVRLGVTQMLERNASERKQLLKMLGATEAEAERDSRTALDLLAGLHTESDAKAPRVGKGGRQKYTKAHPHWTQTAKGRAMQRKRMKERLASNNA